MGGATPEDGFTHGPNSASDLDGCVNSMTKVRSLKKTFGKTNASSGPKYLAIVGLPYSASVDDQLRVHADLLIVHGLVIGCQ